MAKVRLKDFLESEKLITKTTKENKRLFKQSGLIDVSQLSFGFRTISKAGHNYIDILKNLYSLENATKRELKKALKDQSGETVSKKLAYHIYRGNFSFNNSDAIYLLPAILRNNAQVNELYWIVVSKTKHGLTVNSKKMSGYQIDFKNTQILKP